MTFKEYLIERANKIESRIILAPDYLVSGKNRHEREQNYERTIKQTLSLINALEDYLAGIKINRHLVLPFGLFNPHFEDFMATLKKKNLPLIMDAKINDIGATNYIIAQYYYDAGFDALICNPIVGWKEGLEQIYAQTIGFKTRGLIFLGYLSHSDAAFGYGRLVTNDHAQDSKVNEKTRLVPYHEVLINFAIEKKADGVIIGATKPHILTNTRKLIDRADSQQQPLILSPGVGAQGGSAYDAILAGADFIIVGRQIIRASSPLGEVQRLHVDVIDALEERAAT